uniref:CSON009375 protein n=1 Tax=Culicoides sonorensis TaxID=179676 RepID=A0A336MC53_CULSO
MDNKRAVVKQLSYKCCYAKYITFCLLHENNSYDDTMAPSAGKSPPSSTRSTSSYDIKDVRPEFSSDAVEKENQRPPIYNPEDYLLSLKKYGKRGSGSNCQSVYEKSDSDESSTDTEKLHKLQMSRSKTLPAKKSASKTNSVSSNDISDASEMTLRQFGSITDLLTKLRSDLRCAFLSFVQEFVASPVDGVSLLLEALKALQLSQSASFDKNSSVSNGFRNHAFQRRALLDELACLQCLSICCSRTPEAGTRLGTTPIGLLPLAVSATGSGIRSRILAIQLLTVACDKETLSDGSHRVASNGHSAVSDALSTLRLRCGEPVRFRIMVGMFNSGGGSGELQTFGLKFINTFMESAETLQDKLYLQAELHQAGFDPQLMTKTVASTSIWFENLHEELKRWEVQKIDVQSLQTIALNAEQLRSKLITLERRVSILQDEKNILTTMERRLQERCAELQKEVRKLREIQHEKNNNPHKSPVALPRQALTVTNIKTKKSPENTNGKQFNSEHEDEGISGSDTGQSISPDPSSEERFVRKGSSLSSNKFSIILTEDDSPVPEKDNNENLYNSRDTTIEDVIEELENIVSDQERDILSNENELQSSENNAFSSLEQYSSEYEIIPSNLLPAPPKKSKSLIHLFCNPSDVDSSDYMIVDPPAQVRNPFYRPEEPIQDRARKIYIDEPVTYSDDVLPQPDIVHNTRRHSRDNTNRAILNVIMDAREKERRAHSLERDITLPVPAQPPKQYNGVFFIASESTHNGETMRHHRGRDKIPRDSDLQFHHPRQRQVSKSLDRMANCGVDSLIDVVEPTSINSKIIERARQPLPPVALTKPSARGSGKQQSPTNAYNSNFKYSPGTLHYGLPITTRGTSRASSSNLGTRVTDIVSGLY